MTPGADFAVTCAACFGAAWGWCEVLHAVLPRTGGDFRAFMVRQVALMLGRTAGVLVVVGTTAGFLHRSAPAALVGAVAGWLVAAGRTTWRQQRALAAETTGGRQA